MSKEELLTAYAEGSISRRRFVRTLVASGVSVGTAVSYAQLLAPAAAASARHGGGDPLPANHEHYPLITMKILTTDISNVRQRKALKVKVTASESAFLKLGTFVKRKGDLAYLGSAPTRFLLLKGTSQVVTVPIDITDLKGKSSAQVYANCTVDGSESPYLSTVASTKATLN
jgi:hypothetical protein